MATAALHYTLIAHSVGSAMYDSKTGEHVLNGNLFVCETFTDRNAFLTAWVEVSLKSPDTIQTLINGRRKDDAMASFAETLCKGGSTDAATLFIIDEFSQIASDFPALYCQATAS